MPRVLGLCAALLASASLGCGSSDSSTSTSSLSCADGGTSLTYASFGQAFMTSYCISCHGASDQESGIRLDTQAAVQSHLTEVEREAVTSTSMPEGTTLPSAEERAELGEWLACGAN